MNLQLESATLQLARGQVLRLEDAAGRTVKSETGAVWVTEDLLQTDVVLQAGDSYRLHGSALVQALGRTTLSLA